MGGAYTAVGRNIHAIGWNPANLALKSDTKFSISIFSFGFGIHNDSFSPNDYDKYSGEFWSGSDKRTILDKIPDEGLGIDLDLEASILSLSYDSYAIRFSGVGAGDAAIPKEPFEIFLFGNTFNDTTSLGDVEGEGWALASIALSGARPLYIASLAPIFDEFTVGGTVKILKGFGYGKVLKSEGTLSILEEGIKIAGAEGGTDSAEVIAQIAQGGTGFALDLGVAATRDRWTFGGSLINLFGTVSWNKDTEEVRGKIFVDSLTVTKISDVEEFEDLFDRSDTTIVIDSFDSNFPTILRLGAAYQYSKLLWAVDYEQGFSDEPGSTTTPRISGGAEFRPLTWLPLRGGISIGGKSNFDLGLGLGFGRKLVTFDLAIVQRGGATPNQANGINFSMELKVGI